MDAPTDTQLVDALRSTGLRITAPRRTILAAVWANPHADVETIAAAARAQLGAVSRQGVYDVLRDLAEADLIRRLEPAGSPARYEPRDPHDHHHAVCRRCGAIADVDCVVGARVCLEPAATNGFRIDETEITFWGLCPDCQTAA